MSRYKHIKTSDIQNCFTSYLVTAVINKKYQYLQRRAYWQEREAEFVNIDEQAYLSFETEFANYLSEQFVELWDNISKIQELLTMIDNSHLVKAIKKLTDREQKIVFARVFRQSSYLEIGRSLGITEKQAEASYHYAMTKLRKELEER